MLAWSIKNKMKIEIYPLEKVTIDDTAISLGMARSDAEASLGRGQLIEDRYYYFDGEMAIDFDKNEKVEFVEFLGGVDGSLHPFIYGISVFDAKADEVAKLPDRKNAGEIDDSEHGYSYAYKEISVGVYREAIPEDVAEMIEEMRALGAERDGNEDINMETKKADHWATVGVGADGYYR